MESIKHNLVVLSKGIAELEPKRLSETFANDVYEAAWYWRDLGKWVLERNTRVNFPARAQEELKLLSHLRKLAYEKRLQEQYAPIFEAAERILTAVETVEPPKNGHLGILKIIHERFEFLQTNYGFSIVKEEPIEVRFSSGHVYIEFAWAKDSSSSCSFGPEGSSKGPFWIHDLLYLYADQRYRTLPDELSLNSESEIDRWFVFLADMFKEYGRDVLSNKVGIFDELEAAQARRGLEYSQEMDRRYGKP